MSNPFNDVDGKLSTLLKTELSASLGASTAPIVEKTLQALPREPTFDDLKNAFEMQLETHQSQGNIDQNASKAASEQLARNSPLVDELLAISIKNSRSQEQPPQEQPPQEQPPQEQPPQEQPRRTRIVDWFRKGTASVPVAKVQSALKSSVPIAVVLAAGGMLVFLLNRKRKNSAQSSLASDVSEMKDALVEVARGRSAAPQVNLVAAKKVLTECNQATVALASIETVQQEAQRRLVSGDPKLKHIQSLLDNAKTHYGIAFSRYELAQRNPERDPKKELTRLDGLRKEAAKAAAKVVALATDARAIL